MVCWPLVLVVGGFNISIGPYFSPLRLAWLQELGGVFVVAKFVSWRVFSSLPADHSAPTMTPVVPVGCPGGLGMQHSWRR